MKRRKNKMMAYLAVTAGVGYVPSAANAAVVFYGVNTANDTRANPSGMYGFGTLAFSSYNSIFGPEHTVAGGGAFAFGANGPFTQGGDIVFNGSFGGVGYYSKNGTFRRGAVAGVNYANISFNDWGGGVAYEAVAKFYLDGAGGGRLIAIAFADGTTLDDGVTLLTSANAPANLSGLTTLGPLSISAGKSLIDAVPEPSSLALLALGATGLAARRQRKKAA